MYLLKIKDRAMITFLCQNSINYIYAMFVLLFLSKCRTHLRVFGSITTKIMKGRLGIIHYISFPVIGCFCDITFWKIKQYKRRLHKWKKCANAGGGFAGLLHSIGFIMTLSAVIYQRHRVGVSSAPTSSKKIK